MAENNMFAAEAAIEKAYDTDFSIAAEKHSEYAILDGAKEVL